MSTSYYVKKRFEDENTVIYDVCSRLDKNGKMDVKNSMIGSYAIDKSNCVDVDGSEVNCIQYLEKYLDIRHDERIEKNKKYLPIFDDIISKL